MLIPWQLISAVGAIIVFVDRKIESKNTEDKIVSRETKEAIEELTKTVLTNDYKNDKRITLLEKELRTEVKRLDSELEKVKKIIAQIDEVKGGA